MHIVSVASKMFHTDAEKSSIALAPIKPPVLDGENTLKSGFESFVFKTGQLGGKSTRLDIFKIN